MVLPDAPGTTHPGPGGRLVAAADRVAQGEGGCEGAVLGGRERASRSRTSPTRRSATAGRDPQGPARARSAAPTCTCSAATSRRCRPATCSATSSSARSSRSGRACGPHRSATAWSSARSSPAAAAGTARTSCGRCATTATPTPASPRRCGARAPVRCFGYSHAMGGFAGSHAEYIRVPFADHGTFVVPEASSDDSPRCSPRTPARPAGWARTWAGSSPATSWPSGAPAPSARWRPAPRCCSAPSASSSIDRFPSGCSRPDAHRAWRRSTTRRPT